MNSEVKSKPMNYRMSLCSALLLAAATLAGVQPSAQAQDHQVPFRATFSTEGEAVVAPPLVHITLLGEGVALHMGRTSLVTIDKVLNLITLEATATYTLTAANGDTVVLAVEVDYVLLPAGVTFSGEYAVTGGTGRFAGATGGGTVTAAIAFTSSSTSIGSLVLEGSISRPGSH